MKISQPYALNEIGQRQNQEDTIFPTKNKADNNTRFFLVCDGMGGHENGEVASSTVCESFAVFLNNTNPKDFNEEVFTQALAFAYDELDKKDQTSGISGKMGTTLTFLHLNEQEAFLAHIGDSRIYHQRTENGNTRIIYKTSDHSLVNELLRAEVITEEEAENHPKKNIITRAMQPHLERRSKADIYTTSDIKTGDYFFLCSDGILESLNDSKLVDIISQETDDETKMQAICQLCNAASRDNFSAYLIPISEGITETVQLAKTATGEDMVFAEEISGPEAEITAPPIVEKPKKKKLPLIILVVLLFLAGAIASYYLLTLSEQGDDKDKKTPATEQSKPDMNRTKPKEKEKDNKPVPQNDNKPQQENKQMQAEAVNI